MLASERKARLEALIDEPDPARRRLLALGLVSDRLREASIEPILVGGGAVEFYTAGGYATKDIDLAMPHGPETDAAFFELGFTKEGRYWIREDLDLLFEAPAPAGLPGETAPQTGSLRLKTYEQMMADIRERKRERWATILASEPEGRAPGRRPRDPEQERLLLRLDRARLLRRQASQISISRVDSTKSSG